MIDRFKDLPANRCLMTHNDDFIVICKGNRDGGINKELEEVDIIKKNLNYQIEKLENLSEIW